MLQKNMLLHRKVQNNIHIEKMLGPKMSGKSQTIFNGLEMLQRNMW